MQNEKIMENENSIYKMINEIREWNRGWENFANFNIIKPKSSEDFVKDLAERYNVTLK